MQLRVLAKRHPGSDDRTGARGMEKQPRQGQIVRVKGHRNNAADFYSMAASIRVFFACPRFRENPDPFGGYLSRFIGIYRKPGTLSITVGASSDFPVIRAPYNLRRPSGAVYFCPLNYFSTDVRSLLTGKANFNGRFITLESCKKYNFCLPRILRGPIISQNQTF